MSVYTHTSFLKKKKKKDGFPSGSGDKNPPANAGDTNSIPEAGRCHLPRSNQVHAPQLLSLCSRGRKPKLLNPQDATSEVCELYGPCSRIREAPAMRSR